MSTTPSTTPRTTVRWVGPGESDAVALVRGRSYRGTPGDLERFRGDAAAELTAGRAAGENAALVEVDGEPVATATHYDGEVVVRGRRLRAQGVGYVGTDKTHRRGGEKPGAATRVMHALLDRARDEGCVASGLMPFRVSFYEHFGYGVAESRHRWVVPLACLPRGAHDVRHDGDEAAMREVRRREAAGGHVDFDLGDASFDWWRETQGPATLPYTNGTPDDGGYLYLHIDGKHAPSRLSLPVHHWTTPDALRRQLCWLSTLVDQHTDVELHLPTDAGLLAMLPGGQLPHRPMIHATPTCQLYTRLQLRVLDHAAWCDGLPAPAGVAASAVVAVHEPEGDVRKVRLDVEGGRVSAAATDASADVELDAVTWATLAAGHTPAAELRRAGRLPGAASAVLDAFAHGRAPWCNEYF